MQYLYNAKAIREKVRIIFSSRMQKFAIVGFVGNGVRDALKACCTENLTVICWPKAGATSADGVRWLLDSGVNVLFCDNLHHKIYFSEENGVVIGSANLSHRALVECRQHESAVYDSGKGFDLTKILSELNTRAVTEDELHELDVSAEAKRRSANDSPDNASNRDVTFLEAIKTRFPKKWKIVTWSEDWTEEAKQTIRNEVEAEFGVRSHKNSNEIDSKNFRIGDYVLQIKIDQDEYVLPQAGRWLVVDHVVWSRDLRAIIQLNRRPAMNPPFVIDKEFKRALRKAINESGDWSNVYDRSGNPTEEFLRELERNYIEFIA